MKNPGELQHEIEVLRDRMSRLNAAILRISTSLDLDTVLNEIVASARALTGARIGAITTIDAAGQMQGFVTSGFTMEERGKLVGWCKVLRLFVRAPPGPSRHAESRRLCRLRQLARLF